MTAFNITHQISSISQEMLKIYILDKSLTITSLRLQPHLPGPNELKFNSLRPSDAYMRQETI